AILACVVTLAALHPRRLDLTPERRFTLSAHTREVPASLNDDVRITAFYSSQEGVIRREMADLLALYREAQPRIAVRLLDLDRSPGLSQRLGVSSYNTAVVEAGDRRERLELVNEETLTATLLEVAGTPPVATYFVVGHGEHDPRDRDEPRGPSEAARAARPPRRPGAGRRPHRLPRDDRRDRVGRRRPADAARRQRGLPCRP